VRSLDLARDLASPQVQASGRAFERTHVRSLELANKLSADLGFDYALYFAWSIAVIFAQTQVARKDVMLSNALISYPTQVAAMVDLAHQAGILDLALQLSNLSVSAFTASAQGWQQFADQLWPLLQARNLDQDWQFTKKQSDKLQAYFAANELLVQCLKGAVVTDRQAILAGLLAPPAEN